MAVPPLDGSLFLAAHFIIICRLWKLAEALRISSPLQSLFRAKRQAASRLTLSHVHQRRPMTNPDTLSNQSRGGCVATQDLCHYQGCTERRGQLWRKQPDPTANPTFHRIMW